MVGAMPLDLVLRQARIAVADATRCCDIGVAGRPHRGHRAAHSIATRRRSTSTAAWSSAGFVETHIHLDKSCILDRCRCEHGTLEEAIAEVAAAKRGVHRGGCLCARPPHARKGDRAGHDARCGPMSRSIRGWASQFQRRSQRLKAGLCLGHRSGNLRVSAGGPDQRSRHRGASGRKLARAVPT